MNLQIELKLAREGYRYRETVHPAKANGVVRLLQSQGKTVAAVKTVNGIALYVK